MTRFSLKLLVGVVALTGTMAHARSLHLAADSASPVADDIAYRSALFLRESGEHEKALLVLSSADRSGASPQVAAWRDMLAGHLNVSLGRHDDAARLLSGLNDPQQFTQYSAQVLYPLAQSYFGMSSCDRVIPVLERSYDFPVDVAAHVMHIRVACMVELATDPVVLSQAEGVIQDTLRFAEKGRLNKDTLWYAYAYFNVASAASGKFRYFVDADRLFNEALLYVNQSTEGRALKERILLNLGFVNHADNRFDYAAQYFAQMPLDGIWADVSLLAYGWSSVASYKNDMAIEAWRQLVNLPYKSMSVYEGYMAIPLAYERANAYGEALRAYDDAIDQFIRLANDIDVQLKTLNTQTAHQHALQYGQSDLANASLSVPALLARTYTEDRQRVLVEVINDIEADKKRLDAYAAALQGLQSKGMPGASAQQARVTALKQQATQLQGRVEAQLLAQTLAVLEEQRKRIMQYTLDARITSLRLQEEFFQRGGRKLWR